MSKIGLFCFWVFLLSSPLFSQSGPGVKMDSLNRVLQQKTESQDSKGELGVRLALIELSIKYGDYSRSSDELQKAQEMLLQHPSDSLEALLHHQIGNLLLRQEQIGESEAEFIIALRLYEKTGQKEGAARIWNNLGVLALKGREYDPAEEAFLKATAAAVMHNSAELKAITLGNRGNLAKLRGDYKLAADLYKRALNLELSAGLLREAAESAINLGLLQHSQGKFEEAIDWYAQAIEQAKEVGSLREQMWAWQQRSASLDMLSQKEEALVALNKFVDLRKEVYNEETARQADYLRASFQVAKVEKELQTSENKRKDQQKLIWFGLGGVLLLVAVLAIWWNRQRLKRKLERRNRELKLEKQMVEMESSLLRLQMNPHFIFNSLTSIGSHIYQKDTEGAGKLLETFSKLMRSVLAHSQQSEISVTEEIESLHLYLELEKERFGDAFSYDVKVGTGINSTLTLPPMLIQPLVENALRHGIGPKKEAGTVSVAFILEGEILKIAVVDDGVGSIAAAMEKKPKDRPHALELIQRRLRLLYPQKTDLFTAKEAQGGGTEICILVPQN